MSNLIRVVRRNLNYDYQHRYGLLVVKLILGMKVAQAGFKGFGYDEWVDARRKENSKEARLDHSKRYGTATTHLEMLEREVNAIKAKAADSCQGR